MPRATRSLPLGAALAAIALAPVLAFSAAGPSAAVPPAGLRSAPAAAVPAAVPTTTTEVVQGNLTFPWDLAFLPDGRMLVTERPGRIRIYQSGSPGAALLGTVTVPNVHAVSEAGLLGIAVDTDFRSHPYVYVCASREYTGSGGWVNQLLRYTVSGSRFTGPTLLRGGMKAHNNHNGCAVEMDQSGYLWLGMGDGGVQALAQDRSSLNGKVLRMTRDGGVPATNPVIQGRRDVVYTMGHRNPQGIALRPGTSEVWEVEHGPNTDDEVNLLRAGGNYGWPCYTGAGNPNAPAGCSAASAYRSPQWASGTPTLATSGASFLGGAQWGDWTGSLMVSTLKESDVRRMPVAAGTQTVGTPQVLYDGTYGRVRGSVAGPGGKLYLTTSNGTNDRVVRVSPATSSVTRVGGADRYAVAAGVSARSYPGGSARVLVASGETFADALTASAWAGQLPAPLLLTGRDRLPDATRTEIQRLGATAVTVVGGPGTVSDTVLAEIQGLVGGGTVERIGGADRYAVAAAVAHRTANGATPPVLVASGQVFADALAAGPAVAKRKGRLLLVTRDAVPAATAAELRSTPATNIYVVGGAGSVSDRVLSQLNAYSTNPVIRLGGRDRWAVAATVSRAFWYLGDAWVASGENFPDGLTAGAAAGAVSQPLLLGAASNLPPQTGQETLRLRADDDQV
ncbi:MAG: PQQ-dependent sugar dehydrogenase, partial [Micrococcales bacterium]|nr:PQQ-dependent sugar dehydrogenase [Micrococcales bacterium]